MNVDADLLFFLSFAIGAALGGMRKRVHVILHCARNWRNGTLS